MPNMDGGRRQCPGSWIVAVGCGLLAAACTVEVEEPAEQPPAELAGVEQDLLGGTDFADCYGDDRRTVINHAMILGRTIAQVARGTGGNQRERGFHDGGLA